VGVANDVAGLDFYTSYGEGCVLEKEKPAQGGLEKRREEKNEFQ